MNIESALDNLSPDALKVLGALLDASDGNGDDFGLMIDAYECLGMSSHKFAGHVAHLGAFIAWREELDQDPGVQCNEVQYGLTLGCIDARNYIQSLISDA